MHFFVGISFTIPLKSPYVVPLTSFKVIWQLILERLFFRFPIVLISALREVGYLSNTGHVFLFSRNVYISRHFLFGQVLHATVAGKPNIELFP